LSPAFGLGVDRVLQFKIVTPDGQYRTVNKCQNEDLFFALRGGGGGTFGVVLESTSIASPQVTVQAYVVKSLMCLAILIKTFFNSKVF
jgi:FAD/FMN-containing dehydrogenase